MTRMEMVGDLRAILARHAGQLSELERLQLGHMATVLEAFEESGEPAPRWHDANEIPKHSCQACVKVCGGDRIATFDAVAGAWIGKAGGRLKSVTGWYEIPPRT